MKELNNNIEESYCSYEVSKLLKEKGFNIQKNNALYDGEEWVDNYVDIIPTHALAIEWIRVNFEIHIEVPCCQEHYQDTFFFKIVFTKDSTYRNENGEKIGLIIKNNPKYDSPQEATEAALLYTLTNLIP